MQVPTENETCEEKGRDIFSRVGGGAGRGAGKVDGSFLKISREAP